MTTTTAIVLVVVALWLALVGVANSSTRCRTYTQGSTTYTECQDSKGNTKTRCRTYKQGSTTYTNCN